MRVANDSVSFLKFEMKFRAPKAKLPLGNRIAIAVLSLAIGGFSSAASSLEFSGRVLDADTKVPIEGAYVIAVYLTGSSGQGGATVTSHCTKTKGMYTGNDGSFRFPVENLDGASPGFVNGIKAGYFLFDEIDPPPSVRHSHSAAEYSGRDILLKKQDPKNPKLTYWFGFQDCYYAATKGDAAAAADYTRMMLDELKKYGERKSRIEAIEQEIRNLETKPETVERK